MEPHFQLHFTRSVSQKLLHQIQLIHGTSLEPAWVMKDKFRTALKNQFIFDVMFPPLNTMIRAFISVVSNSPLAIPARWPDQAVNGHASAICDTTKWNADEMLHLFALGIVDFGELRSIANTLQERRFTSVGSADDEDSEMNIIEVLFDFDRIQLDSGPFFFICCAMTSILVAHGQANVLATTHCICWTAERTKACG